MNLQTTKNILLKQQKVIKLKTNTQTTRGQKAEARRTTILQRVEQKPHSQKERQDEKAEGYVPDEGTR